MPAGCRCGEEVCEVLVQGAAHRGQPCRAGPQRRLQAVDRHGDDLVPPAQPGGLRRHPVAEIPELRAKRRDHHVRPGQRDPAVGGQAVVGHAAVPLTRVRVAHPQRRHRAPAQGAGRVDRLARGHPGEPPAGPGAEVARSLRDHRDVGAEHMPGGQQPGVHGHRLQVPAERLPGGDRRRQPSRFAERRAGAREPGRQGSAVLHDVDHAGQASRGRPVKPGSFGRRKDPGQHGRERRVQVGHHDGHPADVVRVTQHVVVRRSLLVRAEHAGLQRRVAGLDQVAGQHRVGRQPVRDRDHQGVAAGTQAQVERGGVDQDPVARLGIAGQRRVGQRPHRRGRAVHRHVEFDRTGPLPACPADHAVPPSDHPRTLATMLGS